MTHYTNLTNGSICCEEHTGAYLTASLQAKPKAKTHKTPLGAWQKMDETLVEELSAQYGAICDGCMTAQHIGA